MRTKFDQADLLKTAGEETKTCIGNRPLHTPPQLSVSMTMSIVICNRFRQYI